MHVHTKTALTPENVRARFEASGKSGRKDVTDSRQLNYMKDRRPPKFFLAGVPVPPASILFGTGLLMFVSCRRRVGKRDFPRLV